MGVRRGVRSIGHGRLFFISVLIQSIESTLGVAIPTNNMFNLDKQAFRNPQETVSDKTEDPLLTK